MNEEAIRKDERRGIKGAIRDYNAGRISFERLSEIININYYELAAMCHKKSKGNTVEDK